MGMLLNAFESYRLGVVSTAVCLQKNREIIIASDGPLWAFKAATSPLWTAGVRFNQLNEGVQSFV
jgi:hypothetical protein